MQFLQNQPKAVQVLCTNVYRFHSHLAAVESQKTRRSTCSEERTSPQTPAQYTT